MLSLSSTRTDEQHCPTSAGSKNIIFLVIYVQFFPQHQISNKEFESLHITILKVTYDLAE